MRKQVIMVVVMVFVGFTVVNAQDSTARLHAPGSLHIFTKQPTVGWHNSLVPANYYTHNFGFFCRQELKMQKAKVPLHFRLGSMEQCNRLEEKLPQQKVK